MEEPCNTRDYFLNCFGVNMLCDWKLEEEDNRYVSYYYFVKEKSYYMDEIRYNLVNLIDEINIKFEKINSEYIETNSYELKKIMQFKANFIKNILEDVLFLLETDGERKLSKKNSNIIIRNMVEQLIEFLYLLRHQELIKEYLGEHISSTQSNNIVELSRNLGRFRFSNKRKSVFDMAKDIEQYSIGDRIVLYDIYIYLSEMCHNSYFVSWLKDNEDVKERSGTGLGFIHIQILLIILGCVLAEL